MGECTVRKMARDTVLLQVFRETEPIGYYVSYLISYTHTHIHIIGVIYMYTYIG